MTRVNPYAPRGHSARAVVPDPALPEARLRRLGATDRGVTVLGWWWEGFDDDDHKAIVSAISEMTDEETAAWVRHAEVPDAKAADVVDWVAAQADRRLAAYMAHVAEEAAERPRSTLIETLRKLTSG